MRVINLTNLTKRKTPKILWRKIAREVLGENYDLSVVLADKRLMKQLNEIYRKENKPASVLSFSLSKKEGEIFVNLSCKKYSPFYLFIHALLHLKGFRHSAKMEEQENRLVKKYSHGAGCCYRP